jgi:hypothetical protein
MCPLTIIAAGLGYGILKNPGQLQQLDESSEPSSVWPFMKELVPILIVIIPGLGIGVVLSLAFPSLPNAKEAGLILALCIAIGWVWYENGISKGRIWLTLRDPWLLKMGYMIVSILIFKGILEDSTAVEAISHELVVLHVPLWLIAAALPFLVGLSSGVVIAFVGTTLPILIPLIYALGEVHLIPAYVMLVLACGYTGVLLSPLHLCLLISNTSVPPWDPSTGTCGCPVYLSLAQASSTSGFCYGYTEESKCPSLFSLDILPLFLDYGH